MEYIKPIIDLIEMGEDAVLSSGGPSKGWNEGEDPGW